MEFLSEKFALKSPQSKGSDFYLGAGGALEHVMETLDNESFYSKAAAAAGKCAQAFGPPPRAEHHVRLERTSPCQDGGECGPARLQPRSRPRPRNPSANPKSGDPWGRAGGEGGREAGARSPRAAGGRDAVRVPGSWAGLPAALQMPLGDSALRRRPAPLGLCSAVPRGSGPAPGRAGRKPIGR